MVEKISYVPTEREYIPGLGKAALQPLYDLVHHVVGVGAVHREMLTLAGLADRQRVLDVGCGSGNLLRATGARHASVKLVGLDPDPRALAQAARKFRRAGLTVQLDRGFAQELPYADGAFDRVFSSLMLHHLDAEAKDALLAEVRRVLRPGGALVLADVIVDGNDHKPRGHGGMRSRLDGNVGDAVARRIAAAGFEVAPTRTVRLRIGPTIGVEVAHRR